jgi:hypothetical protein
MIVRTVIEIPGEATLRDVRSIIETLTGLGYVRETDLSEQTMTFEFTADDAAQLTPIQLAIVDAAVRLVDGITSDAAVRAAVAAVSLSDRWEEVLTELRSQGWTLPSEFEIREEEEPV